VELDNVLFVDKETGMLYKSIYKKSFGAWIRLYLTKSEKVSDYEVRKYPLHTETLIRELNVRYVPLWLQIGDRIRIGGLDYEAIDIYIGHTGFRGGRKLGIMAEIDCDKYPEEATSEVELIDLAVEEIQEWDMSGSII
tara:strand:+ start:1944 stop:2357 length:414 start_codon:yes stop_codon:yes gene_type:complete